jgi:hypothetical protein
MRKKIVTNIRGKEKTNFRRIYKQIRRKESNMLNFMNQNSPKRNQKQREKDKQYTNQSEREPTKLKESPNTSQ